MAMNRSGGTSQPSGSCAKAKQSHIGSGVVKRRSSRSGQLPEEKEPVTIAASSGRPITLTAPSTIASRKRRRMRLTREMILNSKQDDNGIIDYTLNFAPNSIAHLSWGKATDEPVFATERRRRHSGLAAFGFRKGRQLAIEKLLYRKGAKPTTDDTPNTNTFPFLQLPLDIRREIYNYLLAHKRPIKLYPDCPDSLNSYSILRVCKQIMQESACVLYKENTIAVSFAEFVLPQNSNIYLRITPCFRNIVVKCKISKWDSLLDRSFIREPEACIAKLVASSDILDSITLTLHFDYPELCAKLTMLENYPILLDKTLFTFPAAELFAPGSRAMDCITTLKCKALNVEITSADVMPIVISINMWPLWVEQHRYNEEQDWFAKDPVLKEQRSERRIRALRELRGLEAQVKNIWQEWLKGVLMAGGHSSLLAQLTVDMARPQTLYEPQDKDSIVRLVRPRYEEATFETATVDRTTLDSTASVC
jgi:hypothetical protein